MANFLTFAEIYGAVGRAIKDFDSAIETAVKEMVNQVYLNEICVCDDLYPLHWLRLYLDSWKIKAPATITGITQANPGVVTAAAHGFVDDDLVSIHNVAGMTEVNDRLYRVDTAAANTFELYDADAGKVNTTTFTAYTSGGTIHHRGFFMAATVLMQRILTLDVVGEGPMTPITPDEISQDTALTNDSTSRPTRYVHQKVFSTAGVEGNFILWYPGADQAYSPVSCWYEMAPLVLSGDADVPLLPPVFHPALVAGTITRLIDNSGMQIENAMVWPGIYNQMLKNLRAFNRRFYDEMGKTQRYPVYML